jgi:hypothetical protein
MTARSIFLLLGSCTVLATLVSLRREHIRTEYSIGWLLVGIIITGLSLSPTLLDRTATVLGVDTEVCLVIVAGILVSMLVFEISHVVSKLRDENAILTQKIAILEFHLQETVRAKWND